MSVADADVAEDVPWRGRFLEVRKRGRWEYAARTGGIHAAVVLALDDGHVILIDQYRVPLGRRCLELPAGLVGDDREAEEATVAGARELEEETGYRAARVESLGDYYSSPGMTSESFTLVRATDLTKVGEGGGEGGRGHHCPPRRFGRGRGFRRGTAARGSRHRRQTATAARRRAARSLAEVVGVRL